MTCRRASIAPFGIAFAATVLTLECAVAQVAAAPVVNPGFEQGAPGAPPTGWMGSISAAPAAGGASTAFRALIDRDSPREGRSSARLEHVDAAGAEGFGVISQALDATSYRGRRVRFTAAVRAEALSAAQVGLWLRVDREAGRMGFFDNMRDRPITSAAWADYTIEGDVASDAERIVLGLLLAGEGRAWIDDVRVEDLGPAAPPAAATIDLSAYVEQALALLRTFHINSASADWETIEARARRATASATQLGDVHDAINGIIADLGERHTFLRPASPAAAGPVPAGAMPSPVMPSHSLLDGRFGLVRVPGFMGNPDQAAQYSATVRDALTSMDTGSRICGWIVDLRDNTGGNIWPMLNGLDPLLGPGPFGAFRTPAGQLTHWRRADASISPGVALPDRAPFYALRAADAPVAVLIGPRTGSSGEMTAVAFAGRERARNFGAASAGLSTANVVFPLVDGATLVVTTAYVRDRTGHEYTGPITPDEPVEAQDAEGAAVRWLESQGSC